MISSRALLQSLYCCVYDRFNAEKLIYGWMQLAFATVELLFVGDGFQKSVKYTSHECKIKYLLAKVNRDFSAIFHFIHF